MECYCYPRNVQDLLSANGVLENQFVGQLFSFGSMIENHPISAQDQTRRPQFGTKVLPGIFLDYALYAGRIWKGRSPRSRRGGAAKFERVRNSCSKTQRKGSSRAKTRNDFIFPCADGMVELVAKGQEVRTSIPARNPPDKGEH